MKDILKKTISAFRFFLKYPKIFVNYTLYRLLNIHPQPYRELKTIDNDQLKGLITSGKSLIRFGDGEAMLLVGSGIHFQKYNQRLQQKLERVIITYHDNSPYVLALPNFALTESNESLGERNRLKIWKLFKIVFKHLFPKNVGYADAMTFYHKETFEQIVAPILVNKHVLILSNSDNNTPELKSRLNELNIKFEYINTKKINAHDEYLMLLEKIKSRQESLTNIIVLTSMGPAGKALAYDLLGFKIQCIDIGHGIEIIGQIKDYSDRI